MRKRQVKKMLKKTPHGDTNFWQFLIDVKKIVDEGIAELRKRTRKNVL